ncbi:MAG: hypothetical protein P8X70_02995, partial [Nanoarchaeota archaeon]
MKKHIFLDPDNYLKRYEGRNILVSLWGDGNLYEGVVKYLDEENIELTSQNENSKNIKVSSIEKMWSG